MLQLTHNIHCRTRSLEIVDRVAYGLQPIHCRTRSLETIFQY